MPGPGSPETGLGRGGGAGLCIIEDMDASASRSRLAVRIMPASYQAIFLTRSATIAAMTTKKQQLTKESRISA